MKIQRLLPYILSHQVYFFSLTFHPEVSSRGDALEADQVARAVAGVVGVVPNPIQPPSILGPVADVEG